MPPWLNEASRTMFALAALFASLGFATLVWKVGFAVGRWVEAQKTRAANEGKILETLRELVSDQKESLSLQREMMAKSEQLEERMASDIRVNALRLSNLEEKVGDLRDAH